MSPEVWHLVLICVLTPNQECRRGGKLNLKHGCRLSKTHTHTHTHTLTWKGCNVGSDSQGGAVAESCHRAALPSGSWEHAAPSGWTTRLWPVSPAAPHTHIYRKKIYNKTHIFTARHVFSLLTFCFRLSVPSMVDLGETNLHIGVNYGKEKHANEAAFHTLSLGVNAAHPAFCVHIGRLCVSSPLQMIHERTTESPSAKPWDCCYVSEGFNFHRTHYFCLECDCVAQLIHMGFFSPTQITFWSTRRMTQSPSSSSLRCPAPFVILSFIHIQGVIIR